MNESQVFTNALKLATAAERAAYLDEACAGNPTLRDAVDALLRAHTDDPDFLEQPVPPLSGTVDMPAAFGAPGERPPEPVAAEQPGVVLAGRYKLLQQIGEGGMGTVFLAEQTHPVQRKVALKLIKSGMDSRQVIARFEAERQALALMDHPNIARVLDAGTTEGGRPYFVMELVKGVPITRYCDEHHLTPRQRLELFVPVCQAVQHAHQKGIIHRDLKPSNVLVCLYDGKPVPKVIDFGIAKATGPRLSEKTLFTELGQVVGTLEYMSPEQAELNQLDIDTRSDIYSLGVLLYELLTGTTPLERKRFKAVAFLEVLRLIREEESPRPSTRLSTTEGLPSIAANRGLEPKKLSGLMRGELDWIVMKTLEKDRSRRYETANGFAMDVQRYLADEPVQACPPSQAYRLKKFLRRNKGPVLAVALVLLALVGGIIGTTIGLMQAQAAQEQAQEEATKAGQERDRATKARNAESVQRKRAETRLDLAADVLNSMTSYGAGDALAQQKVITPEQQKFLKMALPYYQDLLKEEQTDPAQRNRLAAAAYRVGIIEERLGRTEKAAPMYRLARDLSSKLAREFPTVAEYRGREAASNMALGNILLALGKPDQAETQYRAAVRSFTQLVSESPTARHREVLGTCRQNLALGLVDLGKLEEAETEYRAAIVSQKQLVLDFPDGPGYRYTLAFGHNGQGVLLDRLGKADQAERAYHAAIDLLKDLLAEFPADKEYRHLLAQSHQNLGVMRYNLGKHTQAEIERRTAMDLFKQLAAEFPLVPAYRQDLAKAHASLGQLLKQLGKLDQAEMHYRAADELRQKLVAQVPTVPIHRHLAMQTHIDMGFLLDELGKPDQAQTELRAAIRIGTKLAAEFPRVAHYRQNLGRCHHSLGYRLSEAGQLANAETHYRAASDLNKRLVAEFPAVPEYRYILMKNRVNLGSLLNQQGKHDLAETEYRAAIAILKKLVKELPAVPDYRAGLASSHNNLGLLLIDLGKRDEAEKEYAAARDLLTKLANEFPAVPAYRRNLSITHHSWGMLLANLGKRGQAETEYLAAIAIDTKLAAEFPADPVYRHGLACSHQSFGVLLDDLGNRGQAEMEYRAALDLGKRLVAEYPKIPTYALQLGGTLCNLGRLMSKGGRPNEALAWYDQAVATLAPVVQNQSRLVTAGIFLRNSYWGRAQTLDQLKRHDEAAKDWASAMKLVPLNQKAGFQCRVMLSRVRAGQIEPGLKDAEEVARSDFKWVYECARAYALAHAQTRDDKHAARAVELLRRASRGFRDANHVKRDADFDALRARDDFKQLLADLEK